MASIMIDFPEPVSPLITVRPSEKFISSSSIMANCFIDKVCNINSSHPYNKLKIRVLISSLASSSRQISKHVSSPQIVPSTSSQSI